MQNLGVNRVYYGQLENSQSRVPCMGVKVNRVNLGKNLC